MDTKTIDALTYIAISNGYTLGKKTGKFILTDVDPENPAHKYILMTLYSDRMLGVRTDIKLVKGKKRVWRKLKKQFPLLKNYKLTRKEGKKMQEFIYDIEDANQEPGTFKKAWEEYYGN